MAGETVKFDSCFRVIVNYQCTKAIIKALKSRSTKTVIGERENLNDSGLSVHLLSHGHDLFTWLRNPNYLLTGAYLVGSCQCVQPTGHALVDTSNVTEVGLTGSLEDAHYNTSARIRRLSDRLTN